jgi:hypothetical protein
VSRLAEILLHFGHFGKVVIFALVSVAASAIPAILTAMRQLIKKTGTMISIKSGSKEESFDITDLSSQDVSSIIDALKDKPNGSQSKTQR